MKTRAQDPQLRELLTNYGQIDLLKCDQFGHQL